MECVRFELVADEKPAQAFARWRSGGLLREAGRPVVLVERKGDELLWLVQAGARSLSLRSIVQAAESDLGEHWRGESNEGVIEFAAGADGRTRIEFTLRFEAEFVPDESIADTAGAIAAELGVASPARS